MIFLHRGQGVGTLSTSRFFGVIESIKAVRCAVLSSSIVPFGVLLLLALRATITVTAMTHHQLALFVQGARLGLAFCSGSSSSVMTRTTTRHYHGAGIRSIRLLSRSSSFLSTSSSLQKRPLSLFRTSFLNLSLPTAGRTVTETTTYRTIQTRKYSNTSSTTTTTTSKSSKRQRSIADTPLGQPAGSALLDGLDVYTVEAAGDSHPLSVYGIHSNLGDREGKPCMEECYSTTINGGGVDDDEDANNDEGQQTHRDHICRRPILLLHGRTWSSVPVYHLLGGPQNARACIKGRESRSLMEALYDAGLQPYTMDFRGFGGTPPDPTNVVEPNVCVSDVEGVLQFISKRHGLDGTHDDTNYSIPHCELPALLGWSQGALVGQLVAQKSPHLLSKLILYGSIYDPLVRYPRAPLYAMEKDITDVTGTAGGEEDVIRNTYDMAIEDFTVEGTIPPEPARLFAEAALLTDPIKARWKHLHQFNNCDPARVHVPTLVVAGDQDPYAPLHVQGELFANLGRGADRTWSIIADADHAVHLLDGRARFVKLVTNFVEYGRRGGRNS